MWAYAVLLISLGCLCRAIFIKYIRKNPVDLKTCHSFSMSFAPAYLLVPFAIIAGGFIIKAVAFLLVYSGTLKYVGEIILGIVIIPIVLISIISTLVFAMAVYLAPAIIASEEEGFTFVFKRILSIINYIPVRFILYFFTGLVFSLIIAFIFIGILAFSLPDLAGIVTGSLKFKALQLGMSVPGTFVFDSENYNSLIPFTHHIFAFFAYMSMAVILSLVLFVPGVFACSSAVHLYRLIRQKEIEAINSGSEPLVRTKGKTDAGLFEKMICPQCGETVKEGLFFCTQCGNKLKEDQEENR
jgi:hypothetical protein